MPQKCQTCSHLEVSKINKLLGQPRNSYRSIAKQFGLSDSTVLRHARKHLGLGYQLVRQHDLARQALAFDTEQRKLFSTLNKLIDACLEWLEDPDNPDRFTISPRSDEVEIVYLDNDDINEKTFKPARKKGILQDLIDLIQERKNWDVVSVKIKSADTRYLLLDAVDKITKQMELLGKREGIFQRPKENQAQLNRICESIYEHLSLGKDFEKLIMLSAVTNRIDEAAIRDHFIARFGEAVISQQSINHHADLSLPAPPPRNLLTTGD